MTESDSRAGDGKHDSIQCWAASVVVDPLQSPLESPWDSDILDNSADDICKSPQYNLGRFTYPCFLDSGKLPTVPRGRDSYLKQGKPKGLSPVACLRSHLIDKFRSWVDLWNDVDYSTLSSRASSTSSAFPMDYRTAPPRPSHNFLLWLDGALSGLDTSISSELYVVSFGFPLGSIFILVH